MTDHTRQPWAELPRGEAISALIDALRTLTEDEARDMDDAWDATWDATDAAFDAAWYAARESGGRTAWDAAWTAAQYDAWGYARGASRDVAWVDAWESMWDAALALVVADLVGQHGLIPEHLDILTAPVRAVPRLAKIIDRALAGGTTSAQEA